MAVCHWVLDTMWLQVTVEGSHLPINILELHEIWLYLQQWAILLEGNSKLDSAAQVLHQWLASIVMEEPEVSLQQERNLYTAGEKKKFPPSTDSDTTPQ